MEINYYFYYYYYLLSAGVFWHLVIFYLKCAAYKSTYLLTYLLTFCPSVTLVYRYYIQTAKDVRLLSQPGSPIILFLAQALVTQFPEKPP